MPKKIAVLSSGESKNYNALKEYFKDKETEVIETSSLLEAAESDLCVVDGFEGHIKQEILECSDFVKIHPSLLPAFDCKNAVEEAFGYGVKVSGVTICRINEDGTNGKILAQYPVFIDFLTTLEEYREEIDNVSQKLAPVVIESVLKDVVFSFDMLLKPDSCVGNCGENHGENHGGSCGESCGGGGSCSGCHEKKLK